MQTETPQIDVSRVLDAPRELVYRAFTDPDHFVAWWGPMGNALPRQEIEFDVCPGGHQRWMEGWLEALTTLDATLIAVQTSPSIVEVS
ncbi:MAG TPA: SRPBCC domain-containing protein [Pseudonocardiaceae bacterium]|jgi:uncharacterized protein YndB with AHSA1/START domain|nr:SRPBCC domain-containing protein [Pseudonocardiaceae bacterium]